MRSLIFVRRRCSNTRPTSFSSVDASIPKNSPDSQLAERLRRWTTNLRNASAGDDNRELMPTEKDLSLVSAFSYMGMVPYRIPILGDFHAKIEATFTTICPLIPCKGLGPAAEALHIDLGTL